MKKIFELLFLFSLFLFLESCDSSTSIELPTIQSTTTVTSITLTTAQSGGTITSDGGSAITLRGVCWSTSGNPTINDNKTADSTGIGSFTSSITGLVNGTNYYIRAYATNIKGTAYGNEYKITTLSTVTDVDGNIYNTVVIGTQTWLVENLKTTKYRDGTLIPEITTNDEWQNLSTDAYCNYNNDLTNVSTYGRLYNWYAVNTCKLAPIGWHVATDVEWSVLESYLIKNGYNYDNTKSGNKIAKSLASNTNWLIDTGLGNIGNDLLKNNRSGFMALPGGARFIDERCFSFIGSNGFWWSSDNSDSPHARYRCLNYNDDSLNRSVYANYETYGLSVRCVKD